MESASGSDDPQYWYLYDEKWRPIATFRQSDTDPKERFVFHCAGVAGNGSSSYIDAVILRDYDDTYEWNGAGDGSFEQRTYLLQNWRADVVAILDPNGEPIEHVRYSPYGVPSSYPLADVNRDGLVDSDDYDDWDDMFTSGATNARSPLDLNADAISPDTTDYDLFLASYHSTTGMRGGYNKLGATTASSLVISPQNRIGYAGYQWDPAIKQYHVRHRVYNAEVGRWTRRDPAGYQQDASLVAYANSQVVVHRDPSGLKPPGPCPRPDGLPCDWMPTPDNPGPWDPTDPPGPVNPGYDDCITMCDAHWGKRGHEFDHANCVASCGNIHDDEPPCFVYYDIEDALDVFPHVDCGATQPYRVECQNCCDYYRNVAQSKCQAAANASDCFGLPWAQEYNNCMNMADRVHEWCRGGCSEVDA